MFAISLIIFILFSKALLTERHISKGVRFMGKRDNRIFNSQGHSLEKRNTRTYGILPMMLLLPLVFIIIQVSQSKRKLAPTGEGNCTADRLWKKLFSFIFLLFIVRYQQPPVSVPVSIIFLLQRKYNTQLYIKISSSIFSNIQYYSTQNRMKSKGPSFLATHFMQAMSLLENRYITLNPFFSKEGQNPAKSIFIVLPKNSKQSSFSSTGISSSLHTHFSCKYGYIPAAYFLDETQFFADEMNQEIHPNIIFSKENVFRLSDSKRMQNFK